MHQPRYRYDHMATTRWAILLTVFTAGIVTAAAPPADQDKEKGPDYSEQDLSMRDLRNKDLANANFENAKLANTKFDKAKLTGANFRSAKLSFAVFSGA